MRDRDGNVVFCDEVELLAVKERPVRDDRKGCLRNPRPQEQILMGDETFLIEGEPRRDRERLIWTMTLCPA